MRVPSILILAGEASGDHHAAALVKHIKKLNPEIRVSGIGGEKLQEAGMQLFHHYSEINTIALGEGLGKLRKIIAVYRKMKQELQSGKHSVFVPVDFPDVNLRLCKIARMAGVKVCYYISPQIWAWRKGRIKKIAARVDHMMTIFPFEEKLYRDAGVQADFVGHTMVADLDSEDDGSTLKATLGLRKDLFTVALVPGSRPAEITRMFPVMCDTAKRFKDRFPDTQFIMPLAAEHLRPQVDAIVEASGIKIVLAKGKAAEIMRISNAGLVTSGTATLQAALAGMPHVVAYKLDSLTWLIARYVLKPLVMDKDIHVAIANVLAIAGEKDPDGVLKILENSGIRIPCSECGRPLFVPELLQEEASAENMLNWLVKFRSDERLVGAMKEGFEKLKRDLSPSDVGKTAAQIVIDHVDC